MDTALLDARTVRKNTKKAYRVAKNPQTDYVVPPAVLNVAFGNSGDYGPMPCRDDIYRIPEEWMRANAKRFYFTDEQIIGAAVTKFAAPNLPLLSRCYGVYFLISGGAVVYVGMSTDLEGRIFTHRENGMPFDSFAWVEAPQLYLKDIESYYINRIRPALNVDYPTLRTFGRLAQQFDEVLEAG